MSSLFVRLALLVSGWLIAFAAAAQDCPPICSKDGTDPCTKCGGGVLVECTLVDRGQYFCFADPHIEGYTYSWQVTGTLSLGGGAGAYRDVNCTRLGSMAGGTVTVTMSYAGRSSSDQVQLDCPSAMVQ